MAKVSKTKIVHPEAKGLIYLGAFFLLFISLITFYDGLPELNWLGITGYYVALSFNTLFGLGSFILTAFGFWYGFKLLISKKVEFLKAKIIYFTLFLISICFLLNAFAEMGMIHFSWLQSHAPSDTYSVNSSFPHQVVRTYLGGRPLYFLYKDLPILNLQALLSNVGVVCTFTVTAIVTAILFFELSVLKGMKLVQQGIVFAWTKGKAGFEKLKKVELDDALFDTSAETALVPITPAKTRQIKPKPAPELKVKENNTPTPAQIDRTQISDIENVKIYSDLKPEPKLEENFKSKPKIAKRRRHYDYPPLSLLTNAKKIDHPSLEKELKSQATVLEETLHSFGIDAKVGEINCGPTISSFEVHPAIGVKVQKITGVENDIALNMQAKSIRIIAPIPGKAVVGVEVPSLYPQEVGFKEMLYQYSTIKAESNLNIPIVLGKTVSGDDVVCDLTKMPHCIIAGATGSGKSVCINTLIMSILMTMSPDEVKLILIDPKKVELTPFNDLPHLVAPVITEPHGAYAALNWAVKEMQHRYDILKALSLRNIASFNARTIDEEKESELEYDIPEKMHWIVMIIDEFADLMMTSGDDLETPIARIAQMARAVEHSRIYVRSNAMPLACKVMHRNLLKPDFPTRISLQSGESC